MKALVYCSIQFSLLIFGNKLNGQTHAIDTIYVLFETKDKNSIRASSRIHPSNSYFKYPKDWGRTYEVKTDDVFVWFNYHNDPPDWSDIIFDFKEVDLDFIKSRGFKNQKWFRTTSKSEIYNTFLGDDKIIYLIDKSRITQEKATMIRVYFNYPTKE